MQTKITTPRRKTLKSITNFATPAAPKWIKTHKQALETYVQMINCFNRGKFAISLGTVPVSLLLPTKEKGYEAKE